ncbi:hypothetical protein KMC50_gp65 [Ralstonia phage Claudette]|uniref:Uncharacterized protein n=2 Tax=Gervaisevirus claudettte TaxID=2846041 RepID=A0A7G5B845_9CAUD|nr:hypothetical protein KMC50_gp65 [Ralstonia phage Claudette]QMV32468.1 hypothetical protein 20A_00018 [Ralstonia phage Alix]QPD96382.1 hypothetical protein 20Ca_00065 [Ralstonia phage Claudette]
MTKKNAQAAEQTAVTTISSLPPAERAVIVLDSTKTETHLRELVAKSAAITTVVDANGREEAHRAGMNLKNARITITKTGKAAREDATAFCSAVIAEEKRLLGITEAEEERIFGLRDDYDAKIEAEKEERARAERERVAGIQAKINDIRALPMQSASDTAEQLQATYDDLQGFTPTEDVFAEFVAEATLARDNALGILSTLLESAKTREAEAARLAAERAAQEEEARRMAEQRAELERQQRELAEQQAAIARQQEAMQEKALAISTAGALAAVAPGVVDVNDLFAAAGVDESGAQVVITCAPDASPEVRAFVDMGGGDETVIAMAHRSGSVITIVDAPAMPPEDMAPAGYWCNGEYWGKTPDGDGKAAEFVGQELKLTPFWTHGRDVTFVVDGEAGTGRAIMTPATPQDAADLFRSSLDAGQ